MVDEFECEFERGAEKFLIPAYAAVLDIDLDALGISVCSVGGTNFAPYIKMLGQKGLRIPHVVITDFDPVTGKPPRVLRRFRTLLQLVDDDADFDRMTDDQLIREAGSEGFFVNSKTLEIDLFLEDLGYAMKEILESELSLSTKTKAAIAAWVEAPDTLDEEALLRLIERVGKGRFAQRLASYVTDEVCPLYIRSALRYIKRAVS